MKLISGTAHSDLTQRIARHLDQPIAEMKISRFPDGEIFTKIVENVRGHDVFIVQPTCPPVNENLMELLIMIDACRRASAKRITAVVPYFGYARQDRKDQPRVPITAKLVANMLDAAGANRLLTMDLHSEQIQGFFDIPVDHLYAYPEFVKYLRSKEFENPVMVSPDPGSIKVADKYSNMLGCGLAFVGKRRNSPTDVTALNIVGDVDGKDAIIVDDMTSTAGTLAAASEMLLKHGAKSVTAAISHTLLTEKGIDRLKTSPINEFITTDSLPFDVPEDPDLNITVLSIAALMGDAILRIHNNQSVTSLFRV